MDADGRLERARWKSHSANQSLSLNTWVMNPGFVYAIVPDLSLEQMLAFARDDGIVSDRYDMMLDGAASISVWTYDFTITIEP